MNEEIVVLLATKEVYKDIRELAARIVSTVYRVNVDAMFKVSVFSERVLLEEIGLFRKLMTKEGFQNLPQENDALYREVIAKITIFQVKRSL